MKGGTIILHLIGLDWGPISELSFHDKIETMSTPLRQALALRARTSCQPSFLAHASSEIDMEPHLNLVDPKACVCGLCIFWCHVILPVFRKG